MRQAIVLTSFGVADAAERARTIDCIALDLRVKFKDYDVLEAYTSAFLRKKIRAQEGREIPALPDVLERLVREAYTRALILPTHLTPGEEYEAKIRAPYEAYRDRLADLRLAAPVLAGAEDAPRVLTALLMDLHVRPGEQLVLMGHGSPHRHNSVYDALQAHIDSEGLPIHVGVLEPSDTPRFDDVLARLRASAASEVLLAPLLLTGGRHVRQDLAGEQSDSWASRLRAAGVSVRVSMHGLGEYPAFRALYLAKAAEALA